MTYIALITALAAVLAVAAWKVPGAIVTMHKNALDHRHRTMQLQDETDEHAHRRFLEMQDHGRDIPELELAARAAEAQARQADAETQRANAEERRARAVEAEWRSRRSR